MVDTSEHSNQLVVNAIDVDAPVEDVFALIASEAGREAWLEPDPDRSVVVESTEPPREGQSGRISWWWWSGEASPRQVELWVVAVPEGSRVIAIESAPSIPLTMLAGALALVHA